MKQIVTSTPLWFIFLCILIGLVYAFVLYFKNKKQNFKPIILFVLGFLRFASVTLISFLLLSPMILSKKKILEHPVIVMAMDNSSSMLNDTNQNVNLVRNWGILHNQLSEKYQVEDLYFSENVSVGNQYNFNGRKTNVSHLLDYVNQQYGHLTNCKLIIASDGIYNDGKNPLFMDIKKGIDIHTVGTGNPEIIPDIAIKNVFANDISFLNNEFPVEIVVKALKAKGKKVNIYIKKGNQIIVKEPITIQSDNTVLRKSFFLKANKIGNIKYTVSIDVLNDEKNKTNNFQNFYIEVIDEQSKILVLAHSPHPDVIAIKKAIEKKSEYEVTSSLFQTFKGDINQYNLVILHQLPSSNNHQSQQLIDNIISQRIPVMLILGQQTDFNVLNGSQLGIQLNKTDPSFNYSTIFFNEKFQLFELPLGSNNLINTSPPLYCPYADYELSNDFEILFYQRLGNVETSMPMVAFSNNSIHKKAIISGTGLWKWRMKDFEENETHTYFDNLVNVMVKAVVVKQNKDKFRVNVPKRNTEDEPLIITAELYNSVYEPINSSDVKFSITDKDNITQDYLLNKDGNKYSLKIEGLKEGIYKYTATTNYANTMYKKSGEIVIIHENRELIQTTADYDLMQKLAAGNNGFFVKDDNILLIADSLLNDKSIMPVQHVEKSYQPLTHIPLFIIIILLLLSIEWILRKYLGGTV